MHFKYFPTIYYNCHLLSHLLIYFGRSYCKHYVPDLTWVHSIKTCFHGKSIPLFSHSLSQGGVQKMTEIPLTAIPLYALINGKSILEWILNNICSRCNKQVSFSEQNICRIRVTKSKGIKSIFHMYCCETRIYHPRTRIICQSSF